MNLLTTLSKLCCRGVLLTRVLLTLTTFLAFLTFLTFLTLSNNNVLGHDPAAVYPHPSTANYQSSLIIFPQFVIGTSGNINYTSILQITNTNRKEEWEGKLRIHGTAVQDAVQDQAARFMADYTVNKGMRFSGQNTVDVVVAPLGTTTLIFERDGSLQTGFIEINPKGDRKDEVSTSFFFQIHDVNTGELINSVGVAPSDFGWRFAIPVTISSPSIPRGTNTGIAYSHIPVSQRIQIVFELRDNTGKQLALMDSTITYPSNVVVNPYHRALFVTEIFADYFAERELQSPGRRDIFRGSLHIYSQRNINVLALRLDIKYNDDGDLQLQLTSVPSNGELCIDGPNRMDDCFQEATRFPVDWVPVRKKSKNELWSDAGGVCDKAGVCSP